MSRWQTRTIAIVVLILSGCGRPQTDKEVVPRAFTKSQAELMAARTRIGLLTTALNAYALDVRSFPTTRQGLQALMTSPADLPEPSKWHGPYVDSDNSDWLIDPWGSPIQYMYPGKHNPNGVDVWTKSPDGEIIGNWEFGNWKK